MSELDPSGMSMTSAATSPLRAFLRTEAASAAVLVAAIALALVWANVSVTGYEHFWTTELPVRIGPLSASVDVRTWVNSGLMTLFFLVVGLEARREFDLGELRERRRLILPLAAGLAGMVLPVLIYLAFNHSGEDCMAGVLRCRPTPHSRWVCWPSPANRCPTGSGPSC